MKFRILACLALVLAIALPVRAADLLGRWIAEFDTQIGLQKYSYAFKLSGDQITGQATYDHSFGKGTTPLKSIKVDGDKVSFIEMFAADGNEITITYRGTIVGDELKLTRDVGDFATEQLTAKRAKTE